MTLQDNRAVQRRSAACSARSRRAFRGGGFGVWQAAREQQLRAGQIRQQRRSAGGGLQPCDGASLRCRSFCRFPRTTASQRLRRTSRDELVSRVSNRLNP